MRSSYYFMPHKMVTNWGNYPSIEANVTESASVSDLSDLLEAADGLIARGNGRCYGDSSLAENIFSTLKLNKFLAFDKQNGTIECQSGVLLSDILNVIVPQGYFLPVTPGTKFITVGGAIAADVHGKNHHCEGSFANHVVHFDLLTADGSIMRCSRTENPSHFWQTCGGMGLTGIVLNAKFRLKPIESSYIKQLSLKAPDIESVMRLLDESGDYTYSVAWLDCFARKKNLGRSMLKLGEHAKAESLPSNLSKNPLSLAPQNGIGMPIYLPAFSINYASVRAFNFLYYYRQIAQRAESFEHFDSYFYPLDSILNWNRVYGKPGFVQYQFVLPIENSYDGLVKILEKIERSGEGSPLAVLKLFGKQDPNAIMSFPMEGYTLALDFKVKPSDRKSVV